MNPRKPIPPHDWLQPRPVDAYSGTFDDLATKRLPVLFSKLHKQIKRPIPLATFSPSGIGPARLREQVARLRHLEGLETDLSAATTQTQHVCEGANVHDFAGLYVMLSGDRPLYVGITRTILRRLQAHVRNTTHNTASLFFRLVSDYEAHEGARDELNLETPQAASIQEWLRNQSVAILPLACPVERYALELFASMKLETGRWNTFETH